MATVWLNADLDTDERDGAGDAADVENVEVEVEDDEGLPAVGIGVVVVEDVLAVSPTVYTSLSKITYFPPGAREATSV